MKASGEGYQRPNGEASPQPRREGGGKELKDMVNSDYVKKRFLEVMGEKAPAFLASVLNAMRTNPMLSKCEPQSILSSAMVAATLDLPIDPSLGFAAIVPYNTKGRMLGQFQIMYKGFIQLALRSGQYKTINVAPIYEDEFKSYDIITGDVIIEPVEDGYRAQDMQDKIAGYAAFFRLLNGFERIEYWPLKKIVAHGKRFSKSFSKDFSLWKTDPHVMYAKTVLKNTLSKWGILSVSMQMAMKTDQAAIRDFDKPLDDANVEYVDSGEDEGQDENPMNQAAAPTHAALPEAQGVEPVPEAMAMPKAGGKNQAEPVPAAEKKPGAVKVLPPEESQEPPDEVGLF